MEAVKQSLFKETLAEKLGHRVSLSSGTAKNKSGWGRYLCAWPIQTRTSMKNGTANVTVAETEASQKCMFTVSMLITI